HGCCFCWEIQSLPITFLLQVLSVRNCPQANTLLNEVCSRRNLIPTAQDVEMMKLWCGAHLPMSGSKTNWLPRKEASPGTCPATRRCRFTMLRYGTKKRTRNCW